MNYDETFYVTRVGPTLAADYREAARQVGDDALWVVWPARVQADIDAGLSAEASLAKHRAEWRAALDLSSLFPPAPTRERVCGVNLTFQGLTAQTAQFGALPWFEPAIAALDDADRQAVYRDKRAAGDTHAILEFSTGGPIYDEPGQPYQAMVGPNFEANLPLFLSRVEEIILAGLVPIVAYDGDNGDAPADGYPNAVRQLPILADLLASSVHGDLNAYVLYARLWDGVFYGSTPAHITAFGQAFRQRLPNGYLAIEHNVGHIPVGGGEADWTPPNGAMVDYDVVLSEFNNGLPRTSDPNPDTNMGSSIWMVVDRLNRPWNRPADMPTGPRWDNTPPYYLASGTARGPYFYCAFEWDAYRWVRSQVSADEVAAARAYLRGLGCRYTG